MASPKWVLITGTNPGGIGNSLARCFHSHGLKVIATARDATAIEDLSSIGITTFPLEVTNEESIQTLKSSVMNLTGGKLHYLVNNAGRNYTMPAMDLDMSEVKAMFDVNVFGVMRMCQIFAPLLIEASSAAKSEGRADGEATIVQIASVAGITPYVFGSSYNASKAALHTYSDTLKMELEPFGVKVVQIITGGVKSRIARTERILPENSIYKPIEADYNRRQQHSQEVGVKNEIYAERVVRQILNLKNKPKRRIWEGNFSWIVWFVHNYLPHSLMEWFIARTFKLSKLKQSRFQSHVTMEKGKTVVSD